MNHTLLLTNTGDIYAFGDGSNHQVIPELTETALTPQKLHIKSSLEIAAVYADNNTSYALTRNGDIIAWGENTSYKFGDGDYYGNGIAYADIAEKQLQCLRQQTVYLHCQKQAMYGHGAVITITNLVCI